MNIELREDKVILDGYVNVTGRDSRVLKDVRGEFIEQVVPGTFRRALEASEKVDILFNHKEQRRLSDNTADEVQLYEDNIGLRCIIETNDDEIREKAEKNELTGWSFGFKAKKDRWEDGEVRRRYLEEINLLEVSLLDVTPAYIATSVERRGDKGELMEKRFIEDEPIRKTTINTHTLTVEETEEGVWEREVVRAEVETYKLKNY